MADINYNVSYRVSRGLLNASANANNITANMSVTGLVSQVLTMSTNAVSISTANLSGVGIAFFQNLSTNTASTCSIGIDAGGSFVGFTTLRTGEPAIFRMTPGTTYSVVGTAGSRLRVDITEG